MTLERLWKGYRFVFTFGALQNSPTCPFYSIKSVRYLLHQRSLQWHCMYVKQYNLRIFLPVRFFVKSTLTISEALKFDMREFVHLSSAGLFQNSVFLWNSKLTKLISRKIWKGWKFSNFHNISQIFYFAFLFSGIK